ncbi:MAG: phosphoribosylformylglycinamidine cyclo-ligase [Oscillospiraceae bacterium]|nr:phosphoribosylformylglycinamidine cyclo-ligase [Oscillospiraceae bacterium]
MQSHSESYKAAGVDVTAGYRAVELMKRHVARTQIPGVIGGLGGFGGLFAPDFTGMSEPVLVSGADGVGTKLRVAQLMNKHDSVGIDLVAMCVNDILCAGARPLFFLDYIATGKVIPERIEQIIAGISEGCVRGGCALLGGETAEHAGTMDPQDYDLAGFCVGIADKQKLLTGADIQPGDALIALPSSGVHSNGFSLIRKVFEVENGGLCNFYPELGKTLGEELLTPTRIYLEPVLALLEAEGVGLKALAHITGGGFQENIPRVLPAGMQAAVHKDEVMAKAPPIFGLIAKTGSVPWQDMFGTFNMGVGICVVVPASGVDAALKTLATAGTQAYVMGEVRPGDAGVIFI